MYPQYTQPRAQAALHAAAAIADADTALRSKCIGYVHDGMHDFTQAAHPHPTSMLSDKVNNAGLRPGKASRVFAAAT